MAVNCPRVGQVCVNVNLGLPRLDHRGVILRRDEPVMAFILGAGRIPKVLPIGLPVHVVDPRHVTPASEVAGWCAWATPTNTTAHITNTTTQTINTIAAGLVVLIVLPYLLVFQPDERHPAKWPTASSVPVITIGRSWGMTP